MANKTNAQVSGEINTLYTFPEEESISLTTETLSIVGTAEKGPAFVPQQFVSFSSSADVLNTWENVFGSFSSQNKKSGPIASRLWIENSGNQLSYTRVLGIGKGEQFNTTEDKYLSAGFVVGDKVFKGSINPGTKDDNSFAFKNSLLNIDLINSKTCFFGKIVKDVDIDTGFTSPYENYISQLGFSEDTESIAIVTDVVFPAQGVSFSLQEKEIEENIRFMEYRNQLAFTQGTDNILENIIGKDKTSITFPKIYLQGLNNSSKNILSYPLKDEEFKEKEEKEDFFNTNPDYYLNMGHLNYASFRDTSKFKVNNDENIDNKNKNFIAVSKSNWNDNNLGPNFESFESIYQKAKTPWVVSQPVNNSEISELEKSNIYKNGTCKKLFRIHSCSDGVSGNNYRIRIRPRRLGSFNSIDKIEKWSKFDIIIYLYDPINNTFEELNCYKNVNLNPEDENYIGRLLGTEHSYYDIGRKEVVTTGSYKKTNNHVYVEISDDVEFEKNPCTLIPSGFMPYPRLNVSASNLDTRDNFFSNADTSNLIQNPISFVGNRLVASVSADSIFYHDDSYWGILFDKVKSTKIEKILINNVYFNFIFDKKIEQFEEFNPYFNYTKYFQNYSSEVNKKVWIEDLTDNDDDVYNNFFHLEKILYRKDALTARERWSYAFYRRDGKKINNISSFDNNPDKISVYKYLSINDILKSDTEGDAEDSLYLSFDFFTYGGFDGVNILDEYKRNLSLESVSRESFGEIPNEVKGQTTIAYEVGHDLATEESNCRVDVFSMPGITSEYLMRKIVEKGEDQRRYISILDIPDYDESDNQIIDSYYFNNIENAVSDVEDERDSIKTKLIKGSENTIQIFALQNFQSKYSICLMNRSESVVDLNNRVELPASVSFIKSLSLTEDIGQSIDNVFNLKQGFLEVGNVVNSKFNYYTNSFDKTIKKLKSNQFLINPIGVLSVGQPTKTMSSNTLERNNKSAFRLYHNVRIYLDIKRNLKNVLFVEPIINNEPLLFNLASTKFNKIEPIVQTFLENFMTRYQNEGIIKRSFVNVKIVEDENIINDRINNIFRGTVGFTVFGEEDNQLLQISADKLINDINDFTEENNINIINIS